MSYKNLSTDLAEPSQRVGETAPTLLTKKWLRAHYNLCGRALYKFVLTPPILQEIGKTEGQVRQRGFKIFDAVDSERLKTLLNL